MRIRLDSFEDYEKEAKTLTDIHLFVADGQRKIKMQAFFGEESAGDD